VSDIKTVWSGTTADWAIDGTQLAQGDDLATAIIISLFTDRREVSDDLLPDASNDRRGWWADGAVRIGSRLWLLMRAKRTQDTLQQAQDYIAEALQWLIDDGVVARFDTSVEWVGGNRLSAKVVAVKNDGTAQENRFSWVWNGIA